MNDNCKTLCENLISNNFDIRERTKEFINTYINEQLNEYNKLLFEDYIFFNFNLDNIYNDLYVELQYMDGCMCVKNNEMSDKESCECGNDVYYWDDEFMWDKIPMFPTNMKLQKYYEKTFPKRIFKK